MSTATGRTVVLVVLGMPCAIAGFVWAALALLPAPQSHHLTFGLVLGTGGALLVWLGLTGRAVGRVGWLGTVMLSLVGLFLSLLVVREDVCCMYGYHRGLGYPWGWLDSHTTADSLATIEAIKADPGRLDSSVDWDKAALDGLFWWHAAVLLVVPVTQRWRAWRGSGHVVGVASGPRLRAICVRLAAAIRGGTAADAATEVVELQAEAAKLFLPGRPPVVSVFDRVAHGQPDHPVRDPEPGGRQRQGEQQLRHGPAE